MKTDEIKLRIVKFINNTVDAYIPPTSLIEKLKNGTLKLWIEQNIGLIDPMLAVFSDCNGEIDIDFVSHYYEDILFKNGDIKVDVKEIIPSEYEAVKNLLPNKIILFKKNDLIDIFENKTR